MKPILIDSSAWIEFFRDGPAAGSVAPRLKHPGRIVTPTIVLYEVYKRLKQTAGEESAMAAAAQLGKTKVVDLNESLSLLAADVSLSHKLAMADAIVVATARSFGAKILTLDSDFRGIKEAVILRRG